MYREYPCNNFLNEGVWVGEIQLWNGAQPFSPPVDLLL